jgi:aquaporin Z
MARSLDVADVPALLEAMVGWLDPANDVGESAILRRWRPQGSVPSALAGWITRWLTEPVEALRRHWPEYLMEAAGLGLFMISAGTFGTLLFHPGSPVVALLPDPLARRALMGLIMGLTAIAIIYSPWGQQSGAHLNPAVTLTFWRLGKIASWDATLYIAAQFAGGTLGVLLSAALLSPPVIAHASVNYAVTQPGAPGVIVAFVSEAAISFGLMLTVLIVSNRPSINRYTGLLAGALVATYISVEAPLSGMSMNPARSFASAFPPQIWAGLWIYFAAPPLGMLLAAEAYLRGPRRRQVLCCKLHHDNDKRCIFHCGYPH